MLRRACLSVLLFSAFLGLSVGVPSGAVAQQPKGKDATEALRAQIRKDEQQIAALQAEITQGKALVASLQAELKKEQKGDVTNAKTIQTLTAQLAGIRGAKYVHASAWKKKADTTDDDVTAFVDDVTAILGTVKSVRVAWAGKPPTTNPDIDFMLVLAFDDAAAFEQHKDDPLAKKFHDKYDAKFETPKATDLVVPVK